MSDTRGDKNTAVSTADILISRIVDGEANDRDRNDFRGLAESTPALWQELAEQRMQLDALSNRVAEVVRPALAVELPRHATARGGASWRWALTFSGWAALIAVSLSWLAISQRVAGPASKLQPISAEEHFDQYLSAPNVLGELEPVILEVHEMSDGRTAIRFLQRVEKFIFVEPGRDETEWMDQLQPQD